MDSVQVSVKPQAKVSRLEVIIRIPYGIILGIIGYILGIIASIIWVINIITCLILAKRVLPNFMAALIKWYTQVAGYMMLVTDERPPLFPEMK
jgi:hypothetical protein